MLFCFSADHVGGEWQVAGRCPSDSTAQMRFLLEALRASQGAVRSEKPSVRGSAAGADGKKYDILWAGACSKEGGYLLQESYVFRIVIVYPREAVLLKLKKDERGMLVSKNNKESIAFELTTPHASKHAAQMLG